MLKFSLLLIFALSVGTFLATTDVRAGGGRDVYMMYVKPYKDAEARKKAQQPAPYAARPVQAPRASSQAAQARAERRARAQAEAAAQARAAARNREIAAQRAATAKASVEKASADQKEETLVPKTEVSKTEAPKTEAAKSEVLKADDDAPPLAKADLETPATTAVKAESAPQTCRKYSAAVGGMIDAPCGE